MAVPLVVLGISGFPRAGALLFFLIVFYFGGGGGGEDFLE